MSRSHRAASSGVKSEGMTRPRSRERHRGRRFLICHGRFQLVGFQLVCMLSRAAHQDFRNARFKMHDQAMRQTCVRSENGAQSPGPCTFPCTTIPARAHHLQRRRRIAARARAARRPPARRRGDRGRGIAGCSPRSCRRAGARVVLVEANENTAGAPPAAMPAISRPPPSMIPTRSSPATAPLPGQRLIDAAEQGPLCWRADRAGTHRLRVFRAGHHHGGPHEKALQRPCQRSTAAGARPPGRASGRRQAPT